MKITAQQVIFDEKGQSLLTKYDNGMVLCEPLTSTQAAKWEAEHRY